MKNQCGMNWDLLIAFCIFIGYFFMGFVFLLLTNPDLCSWFSLLVVLHQPRAASQAKNKKGREETSSMKEREKEQLRSENEKKT